MTEIYSDASYFSTIRDEGKAEIAFFDKPSKSLMNISADMTRYGVTSSAPYAVIRGGDYSRLKEIEYDYNGNGKTEASGLMPLNSLGFSVEFLSDLSIILEPTADGFDRDNGCNIVVILDHKETEIPDMIEEIYARYYHGGLWDGKPCAVDYYSRCGLCFYTVHIMDGFNAISEKVERIDISAHDPYMRGWKLRGVLVIPEGKTAEDIIQPVDNGDIENLTITSKYDITRYALPSVEAEIKLFNFGKKYTDIQPDMVLVMNKYTDTDSDVTYYSDTRAYFIDGVGNPDNSTDTPRVTFKAVDLLTKLNMNYSCDISADELNYYPSKETSVGSKITKVLQSAQSDFPLCNSGVYSEFNTGKTANSALDYTWRYNAVTNVPYNTVLQKLISVTWAYPVAVDDVITFEGASTGSYDSMAKVGNPKGSGAAIKLREQMAKPKITVNPCTQLVTQSLNMCKYKDGVKGDSRETDWLEQICSVTVRFEGADIPQRIKYDGTWVILPSYIYDDGYTDYGVYISDDVNFRAWYSNNEVPGFTFKNNTAESYVEITPYDSKIKGNTTVVLRGYRVDISAYEQSTANGVYSEYQTGKPVENLSISNDLIMINCDTSENFDVAQNILHYAANFVHSVYVYNECCELDLRGRFDLDVRDVIPVEIENGVYKTCVITEHKLTYNGAFRSSMKVYTDGETIIVSRLTPSETLYPSDNLTPKKGDI